jgi:hypothetical protein
LTCSSLTDISQFPENTNVEFTNVFDNQVDFADVTFLALEKVWITTGPPGPPPTIATLQWAAGQLQTLLATPITEIGFASRVPGGTPNPYKSVTDGSFNFNLIVQNSNLPSWANGRTIQTDEERDALILELQTWFEGGSQYFSVVDSTSGMNTYMSVVSDTVSNSVFLNSTTSLDGTNLPDIDSSNGFGSIKTGPQPLGLRPNTGAYDNTLYTSMGVTSDFLSDSGMWMISAPSGWSISPGTNTLVAVMSDASVVPLATVKLDAHMGFVVPPGETQPPPATAPFAFLPFAGEFQDQLLWDDNENYKQQPFDFLSFHGAGANVANAGPAAENPLFAIDAHPMPLSWNFTVESLVTTRAAVAAPMRRSRQSRPLLRGPYGPKPAVSKPIKYSYYENDDTTTPGLRALNLAATPTYDNILLITCNELVVDRLAGSSSTQLLAVLPFDYSLLALGFYNIPIPVNSLVWRHLADKHIRTLTFKLYNGLGEPHPALAGLNFTTTLQLRYL